MQFNARTLMQQAVEDFRSIVAYTRNESETGDDDTSHDPKLPRLGVDLSGFKAHTIAQSLCFATTELSTLVDRFHGPK